MADHAKYYDSIKNKKLFFEQKIVINPYYLEPKADPDDNTKTQEDYWTSDGLRKITIINIIPDNGNQTPTVFVNNIVPVTKQLHWLLSSEKGEFAPLKITVSIGAKVLVIEEKIVSHFDETEYRKLLG